MGTSTPRACSTRSDPRIDDAPRSISIPEPSGCLPSRGVWQAPSSDDEWPHSTTTKWSTPLPRQGPRRHDEPDHGSRKRDTSIPSSPWNDVPPESCANATAAGSSWIPAAHAAAPGRERWRRTRTDEKWVRWDAWDARTPSSSSAIDAWSRTSAASTYVPYVPLSATW